MYIINSYRELLKHFKQVLRTEDGGTTNPSTCNVKA